MKGSILLKKIIVNKKVKIKLSKEQKEKVQTILESSNDLWNLYLEANQNEYKEKGKFISAFTFGVYINNVLAYKPEYDWIKRNIPNSPRSYVLRRCERAYKYFFKKLHCYPNYKTDKNPIRSYVFDGNQDQIRRPEKYNKFYNRIIDDNHIHIPHLGIIELYETGYITEDDLPRIKSGILIYEGDDNYYLSYSLEYEKDYFIKKFPISYNYGLGIDVGIRNYMTIYNGHNCISIKNISRSAKVLKIQDRITRLQHEADRKMKLTQKFRSDLQSNNVKKIYKKIRKLHRQITNIKNDYINKIIADIIIYHRPQFITIEDLEIKQLIKKSFSRKFTGYILNSCLDRLLSNLSFKGYLHGTEIRIAPSIFPSSKLCSQCGYINDNLTLNDTIFKCPNCGLEIDRDENAAINLYNLKEYTVYDPTKHKFKL